MHSLRLGAGGGKRWGCPEVMAWGVLTQHGVAALAAGEQRHVPVCKAQTHAALPSPCFVQRIHTALSFLRTALLHCSIAPGRRDRERASPAPGAAHSLPEVVAMVVGAQGPELPDGSEQDPSAVPAAVPGDLVHSYREGLQRSSAPAGAHTTTPLGPADPSSAGAGLEEAWLQHTPPQWISDPDVQLCCQQPSWLPIAQLPREDQEEGGHGATWQCGVQRDAGGGRMPSPGAVHPAGASLPSHTRTRRAQAARSWPVSTTAPTPWPADRASKHPSNAGGLLCSASYIRKNMYMFHMHKRESLKAKRMQLSINYSLDNIFYHHQINQALFSPYVHRFNGSNSALGAHKTPASCRRTSQTICHLAFACLL